MRFSSFIAFRYLFGKKSTNAINVITGISITGICIGTAALILVLSVFNGFEELLAGLMNSVNADIKVEPNKGKTFQVDSSVYSKLLAIEGVESISYSLEETALLEYRDKQDFCTLKGVDDNYSATTIIDSAVVTGSFILSDDDLEYLVLGGGIANRLGVAIRDVFEPVSIYMPNRNQTSPLDKPFKRRVAYPAGFFAIKQDFDYTYVFCSLQFMQELLERPGEASAIEIAYTGEDVPGRVLQQIGAIAGEEFDVKDRYAQNEALFKLMQIEKWLSFAIVGLILLIVSFNLIVALWMIVLDKRRDISVLQAIGASVRQVRSIIYFEGLFVSIIGIVTGGIIALVLTLLQKRFGLISFPEGFVVDAYPIVIRPFDVIVVALAVIGIGLVASILPARRASLISPYVREE